MSKIFGGGGLIPETTPLNTALTITRAISRKKIGGVLGTRRRRRRGRVAAGDETETPKASRGVGNGEGVSPSPSD